MHQFYSAIVAFFFVLLAGCPENNGSINPAGNSIQQELRSQEHQARDLCIREVKWQMKRFAISTSAKSCDSAEQISLPQTVPSPVCEKEDYTFQKYLNLISGQRATVNDALLRECMQEDNVVDSTTWMNGRSFFDKQSQVRAKCAPILTGSKAALATCEFDEECVGDTVCRVFEETKLVCQPPNRSLCNSDGGNDENCGKGEKCGWDNCVDQLKHLDQIVLRAGTANDSETCKNDGHCNSPCSVCRPKVGEKDKFCASRGKKDDPCLRHEDCEKGLDCRNRKKGKDDSSWGSCGDLALEGAECYRSSVKADDLLERRCQDGLYCFFEDDEEIGICRKLASLNDDCEHATDCGPGLLCDKNGKCVGKGISGLCKTRFDCDPLDDPNLGEAARDALLEESPYYCDADSICKVRKPLNSPCDENEECAQGTKCKKADPASDAKGSCKSAMGGEPCEEDEDCDSNNCIAAKKLCGAASPVATN